MLFQVGAFGKQESGAGLIWQPVKANGMAAIFLDDMVEVVLYSAKKDNTGYHMQAIINPQDNKLGAFYAGISAELPVWDFSKLTAGTRISLNGREWELRSVSQFPKRLEITDGKTTLALEEGKSIDFPGMGSDDFRWTVHFGNENYIDEVLGNATGIGGKQNIWLLRPLFSKDDMQVGDRLDFPSIFEGGMEYSQVAQTHKLPVQFDCLKLTGLPFVGEDGKDYNFRGGVIRIRLQGEGRMKVDGIEGGPESPISEIFVIPGSINQIYYDANGDGTYALGKEFSLHGKYGSFDTTWKADIQRFALTFEEEKLSSSPEKSSIKFGLPLYHGGTGFQFQDNRRVGEFIQVTDIGYRTGNLPCHTAWGSDIEEGAVGLESATIQFSLEPKTALIKLDAPVQQQSGGGQTGEEKKEYEFKLEQNYPNPFNSHTTISYSLAKDCDDVRLTVFDAFGRKVKELVGQGQLAGDYKFDFDGSGLPSGVYTFSLVANDKRIGARKMMLVK